MKVADASVAVAAASPWHESHEAAFDALATSRPAIVAHAAIETYSALTRMPEPNRMHPRRPGCSWTTGSRIGGLDCRLLLSASFSGGFPLPAFTAERRMMR